MKDPVTKDTNSASAKSKSGLSRKLRFGSVAMVTTAVVVVVVILLNIVMETVENRYPLTVDLTSDGTYSLSEESLTLARNLENDTEVVVFLNENVFTADDYTPFNSYLYYMQQSLVQYYGNAMGTQYYTDFSESFTKVLEQFYNMLKTYRAESNGKFTYRFVDLDSSPALAAAYDQYDPEVGDVLFLGGDRHQKSTVYEMMGGDVNQNTMIATFNSQVEMIVASKINLVSSASSKKATILTFGQDAASGEYPDVDNEVVDQLNDLLPLNGCMVTTLDITTNTEPEADTDVFIIPAASADYTVDQIEDLRSWLNNDNKRGKDLLVFTDYAAEPLTNLYQFLNDEYGIEVLDAIVYETDTNMQYSLSTRDPAIDNYATVAETEYTQALAGQRVLVPTSNALKLHFSDSAEDSEYSNALITSAETAQLMSMTAFRELANGGNSGATIESTLSKAEEYPIVSAAFTTASVYSNPDQAYYSTDVMVFGSADFMHADNMNTSSAVNEDMFLSVFRGLTGLETTLSISARKLTGELLEFESRTVPTVLGHAFVWGLPVILLIVAVVVFVRRRRL